MVTGNTLSVRVTDGGGQFVIADAVRVERLGSTAGPEIEVLSGATSINDGGTVDFGTTAPNVAVDRLLTVRNTGTANLTLSSINPAQLPAGYTLLSNLGTTSLAPGASTTFALRLQSATSGVFGGLLSLANNDADESPYDLNLVGTVSGSTTRIIDDGDVGFSFVGNWQISQGQGYQNDIHYITSDGGNDVARWTFDVTPGRYRVSATWSADGNRATDAPFTILDGNRNLGTVDLNQRTAPNDFADQGALWENLGGPYDVVGSSLVVQLSDDANGFVIADAVRVEKIAAEGPEIEVRDGAAVIADGGVLDFGATRHLRARGQDHYGAQRGHADVVAFATVGVRISKWFHVAVEPEHLESGAGATTSFMVRFQSAVTGNFGGTISFANTDPNESPYDLSLIGRVSDAQIIDNGDAGFSTVGSWLVSAGEGYGQDIHYSSAGTGNDVARWTFDVVPGRYRVSATWSVSQNRATDSPFTVLDGTSALATVDVNQLVAPNDFTEQGVAWEDLGGPYDIAGSKLVVQLTDNANQFVIADAILIERIGDLAPEIEVFSETQAIADGGVVDFGRRSPTPRWTVN